jgi:uncharacterized protein
VHNFTPIASLAGGILIGLSASAMLLFDGQIAGISGIFAGILRPAKSDSTWKICFVTGLVCGGLILRFAMPSVFDFGIIRSFPTLIVAGLLVGFGTRLGNGCASGHGVCGMGRFSLRSSVATAIFVTSGAITVFVVDHILEVMR